jgi:hypothetical protein
MNKETETVRKFIREQKQKAVKEMAEMDMSRKKGSFAFWAQWNLLPYVSAEMTMGYWAEIERAAMAQLEDEPLPLIIAWVKSLRNGFMDDVMRSRSPSSTNQIANIFDMAKTDVCRKIAGTSLINTGSLMWLLMELNNLKE